LLPTLTVLSLIIDLFWIINPINLIVVTLTGFLDMVKAIWKDKVIAETNNYEMVEGNYYFFGKIRL